MPDLPRKKDTQNLVEERKQSSTNINKRTIDNIALAHLKQQKDFKKTNDKKKRRYTELKEGMKFWFSMIQQEAQGP